MKPLPLWSLSKTPETGAYALSSPSRTTLLLVAKESDGRIAYNSREKEDTLSLKCENKTFCMFGLLHFFLLTFSFPMFYPFSFSFLFPISLLIFSSFLYLFLFSLCISPHFLSLFGATTHPVKRRKFPPLLPQAKCMTLPFPSLYFDFIIPYYDIMHSSGSL